MEVRTRITTDKFSYILDVLVVLYYIQILESRHFLYLNVIGKTTCMKHKFD